MADAWDDELDQQTLSFNQAYSATKNRDFNSRDRSSYDRNRGRGGRQFCIGLSDVCKVIGRGGSKIREFEAQCGGRIKIDKQRDEATVEIIGSEEAGKKGQELIEEFLKENGLVFVPVENGKKDDDFVPIDWAKVRADIKAEETSRKAKFDALPKIVRDFYFENIHIANMHPSDVERFRVSKNNITVTKWNEEDTRSIPNPVMCFEHAFADYPEILREIQKQKFKEPSPIQCQAWPILLKGYDLIGIAQTGSGKTLAFLLPAFIHIESQVVPVDKRGGPTCLILAPTRELALQILEETKKYSYHGIRSICIYGGASRREQIGNLDSGAEIVIATPGRLNDLICSEVIDMSSISYLVLDEADRMLDLGFEPQIKFAMKYIRPDRHTVMTSATWPVSVQEFVNVYMNNPFKVNVGSLDLSATHSVQQIILFSENDEERREMLFDFIEGLRPTDKALVFVDRKALVDDLASDISLKYMDAVSFHGDLDQRDREATLADFKNGLSKILVATDLASRGLDVKDVTHVFNMNLPKQLEDYVHRIGRTGRAGQNGIAITVLGWENRRKAADLIKILEEANQEVPDRLYEMASAWERYQIRQRENPDRDNRGRGRGGRGGRGRPPPRRYLC